MTADPAEPDVGGLASASGYLRNLHSGGL